MKPLGFPKVPAAMKLGLERILFPKITVQGNSGAASTISVEFHDPQDPHGILATPVSLRVRVCNSGTITNSTNATIAPTLGCTTIETHTSTKDLTLQSALLINGATTLTSNNTNVTAGDTVTLGGTLNGIPYSKVYTFRTSVTTEGDVLRGGSADASLLNFANAITHKGTPGTDYICAGANPLFTASSAVTAHAITITALFGGSASNSFTTTTTASTLSFTSGVLAGGQNAVPGVIAFTVTDASVESVDLHFGRPLVGGLPATYENTITLTNAT